MRNQLLFICSVILLLGCNSTKKITFENNTKEPVYLLLKNRIGIKYINTFNKDTLIPFGTKRLSKSWELEYDNSPWTNTELEDLYYQLNNPLYLEVYDAEKQRIQNTLLQFKRKGINKNHLVIKITKNK